MWNFNLFYKPVLDIISYFVSVSYNLVLKFYDKWVGCIYDQVFDSIKKVEISKEISTKYDSILLSGLDENHHSMEGSLFAYRYRWQHRRLFQR